VLNRPSIRIALTLLVAVSVHGVHGAPARAMTELRAIDCCANTCHKADPIRDARGCCQVAQSSGDVGAITHVSQPQPPVVAGTIPTVAAMSGSTPAGALGTSHSPHHRAGPIFLLTASLRL
jgi:hypothetical protein